MTTEVVKKKPFVLESTTLKSVTTAPPVDECWGKEEKPSE